MLKQHIIDQFLEVYFRVCGAECDMKAPLQRRDYLTGRHEATFSLQNRRLSEWVFIKVTLNEKCNFNKGSRRHSGTKTSARINNALDASVCSRSMLTHTSCVWWESRAGQDHLLGAARVMWATARKGCSPGIITKETLKDDVSKRVLWS